MDSGGIQRRRRMGAGPAIAADTADIFPSSQQQGVRKERSRNVFKVRAVETRSSAQSRCYTTCSNLDPMHKLKHFEQSDFSETKVETLTRSSDGSVCSDDSRTTADSLTSVLSLQLQALFNVSPYYLDSTDKLINLPDDLIKEVLRRLTVKEIVRMGCLNTMWRSEMQRLIDGEQFNCT